MGSKVSGRDNPTAPLSRHTSDYVFKTAQKSLEKIRVDFLDIYWLHAPDRETPWKETLAGLDLVVKEGIAQETGVSNVSAQDIRDILKICEQNNFIKPKIYPK